MAEIPYSQARQKEQDPQVATLPDGNRSAEQKIIADDAITKIANTKHERREVQEQQLDTQRIEAQGNSHSTSRTGAATQSSRSREQNQQLAQGEPFGNKSSKKHRGLRASESDEAFRNLATVLGPDTAANIVSVIENRAKLHPDGLAVNAPDIQQLAKDISAALKGRSSSDRLAIFTASTETERDDQLLAALTHATIVDGGSLSITKVTEVLSSSNVTPIQLPAPVAELQAQIDAILAERNEPAKKLAGLYSSLDMESRQAFHRAVASFEIKHKELLLEKALSYYPKDARAYGAAIDTYIDTIVEQQNRFRFTEVFLARRYESSSREFRELCDQQSECSSLQKKQLSELLALRDALLTSLATAQAKHAFSPCPPHLIERLSKADPLTQEYVLLYANVCETSAKLIRTQAEKSPETSQEQLDAIRQLADDIDKNLEATRGCLARLQQHTSELHLVSQKIGVFWVEFEQLYHRAAERLGLTKNLLIPPRNSDADSLEIPQTTHPHGLESSSHAGDPIDSKEEEVIQKTFGQSGHTSRTEEQKSAFEKREEADLERSFAEVDARRFALAGDFANAEAEITAYNNRFPDYPISRDFIRLIKEAIETARSKASTLAT